MKTFATVNGTNYYYGSKILKTGDNVLLFKDLNNKYDNHAIKVVYLDYGVVGHVCNKWNLAMQKTEIADNIYDRIGNSVFGTVERITIYGFVVSTDFHGYYLKE